MAPPTSSWLPVAEDSDFTIFNIPFGVAKVPSGAAHIVTALGDAVIDLAVLADAGLFGAEYAESLKQSTLNDFMGAGRGAWRDARARLLALLASPEHEGANPALRDNAALRAAAIHPLSTVTMLLPAHIGDYTDFYSSREHATNVGIMFRGAANALQPNWLHLPVGYHGRSSSIVVSGHPVRRPCGQLQADADDASKGSIYGPCRALDFELEMAIFVGPGNELGEPIDIAHAQDHIFGLALLNDWSARDIQKWEYVPLGPFGAKNFCTTISPWIVTMEALEPFKCETSAVAQTEPVPLPYLRDPDYGSYDVALEVSLTPKGSDAPVVISRSNLRHMYWSVRQQLVHHTVTGCNMRPGDMLGTGTISGTAPDSFGSMLELAWNRTKPLPMPDGSSRVYLLDGDVLSIKGVCAKDGRRIGFGPCAGAITPAKPYVAPAATGGSA